MAEQPENDDWTCGKPGCDLSVEEHDFGMALSHIFEKSEQWGSDTADRILDRAERGLLGGDSDET